ncbi:hypothetical protein RJ639_046147, partial [Escallonia herrerae]
APAVSSYVWFCKTHKASVQGVTSVQGGPFSGEYSTPINLQLSYKTIRVATDKFSRTRRVGQHALGPVYKGILPNGQEIAVESLSTKNKQAVWELVSDIELFAKLQHPNLVRLLGYRIEANKVLLVDLRSLAESKCCLLPVRAPAISSDFGSVKGPSLLLICFLLPHLASSSQENLKASSVMNWPSELGRKKLVGEGFSVEGEGTVDSSISNGDGGQHAKHIYDDTLLADASSRQYRTRPPRLPFWKRFQSLFRGCASGILPNGQEIAVERLYMDNERAVRELAYEMEFFGRLQHPNLVRLLGFCFKADEVLLIYEFLPNASVAYYLSDPILKADTSSMQDIVRCVHIGLLCVQELAADRPCMAA